MVYNAETNQIETWQYSSNVWPRTNHHYSMDATDDNIFDMIKNHANGAWQGRKWKKQFETVFEEFPELVEWRIICDDHTLSYEDKQHRQRLADRTATQHKTAIVARFRDLAKIPNEQTNKNMATKEINCEFDRQIFDYGEPCAYFTVKLPKEAKVLSKQTDKERPTLSAICLQPSLGKLIASDGKILTAMDVECSGEWPEDIDGKPFECFIDPKAISSLAGKEVDVAVWRNKHGQHLLTGCEALGVRTQYAVGGARFADWRRVMPEDKPKACVLSLKASEIEPLRKLIDKCRSESKKHPSVVFLRRTPDANDVHIRIFKSGDEIGTMHFALNEYPAQEIHREFDLELFYLAMQGGFNGEIAVYCDRDKATFGSKCGTTLMFCRAVS